MAELSDIERSFDEIKNKSRVSTPNPWLDPKFNRIDPWGKEPGIRVDDIPERLGLIQQGQTLDLLGNDFIDLGDTPSNYGKSEQFVKTDGEGKLTFDWPYWIKAGSSIYYKKGNVGVGLSCPTAKFHTYGDNILDGAVTINESGRDKDFRVEGDTEANLLFCDASTDRVAVGLNAPLCRTHIRGVVCADYAGLHPDTILLIENDDHVYIQLQGSTGSQAGIIFADDDYNPPAGLVRYDFANEQMEFTVGTNDKVVFKSNHAVFMYGYIHLDSPTTYAVFVADSHNADSYVEYKEDGSTKWTAGFDYTDSFKYQISEGVPGTNVRFEIEPGASGLINCYQNIAVRNTKGILLYDNGNYVGFRAPALSADQIWVLPSADASQAGSPLVSNASGTLSWAGDVDLGAGNLETDGHVGIGGVAPNVVIGLNYEETVTIADNVERFGITSAYLGQKTSAAFTSHAIAILGRAYLAAGNTQDWTVSDWGLVGVEGAIETLAGSSGTVTGAAALLAKGRIVDAATVTNYYGLYILDPAVAGAKLTNAYGIYIADIDSGSTLNYSIYSVGGLNYFGGATTIGNLTLDSGSITDSSGAISFGNENLSTTGIIGIGGAVVSGVALNATSATDAYMRAITSGAGGFARFRAQGDTSGHAIEFFQFGSTYAGNDSIGIANAGLALIYTGNDTSNLVIRCGASASASILFGTGSNVDERLRISPSGNIGMGQSTFGTNAMGVFAQNSGTAPTTSPANCFQMYSADIITNHAAMHIRNENDTIIKLYQQAHIVDASVAHSLADTGETCDRSDIEAHLDALGTKINSIYTALENNGLLASA